MWCTWCFNQGLVGVRRLSADHMTQKADSVTLTSYGQAPMGLEGSGASRRPGSIVRVLRTE